MLEKHAIDSESLPGCIFMVPDYLSSLEERSLLTELQSAKARWHQVRMLALHSTWTQRQVLPDGWHACFVLVCSPRTYAASIVKWLLSLSYNDGDSCVALLLC